MSMSDKNAEREIDAMTDGPVAQVAPAPTGTVNTDAAARAYQANLAAKKSPQPAAQVAQATNAGGQLKTQWRPDVALVLSLFLPGAGQYYKGQTSTGVFWFLFVVIGYVFFIPGIVIHLCCIIDAAVSNPEPEVQRT